MKKFFKNFTEKCLTNKKKRVIMRLKVKDSQSQKSTFENLIYFYCKKGGQHEDK